MAIAIATSSFPAQMTQEAIRSHNYYVCSNTIHLDCLVTSLEPNIRSFSRVFDRGINQATF